MLEEVCDVIFNRKIGKIYVINHPRCSPIVYVVETSIYKFTCSHESATPDTHNRKDFTQE